jgi:hypothetical protein
MNLGAKRRMQPSRLDVLEVIVIVTRCMRHGENKVLRDSDSCKQCLRNLHRQLRRVDRNIYKSKDRLQRQ